MLLPFEDHGEPTAEELDAAPFGTKVLTRGRLDVHGAWWVKVDPAEYVGIEWRGAHNPNRLIGKGCLYKYAVEMEPPR